MVRRIAKPGPKLRYMTDQEFEIDERKQNEY